MRIVRQSRALAYFLEETLLGLGGFVQTSLAQFVTRAIGTRPLSRRVTVMAAARGCRTQLDAVDGAGRQAQFATRAVVRNYRVHSLGCTDNRIDGTGGQAACAADAALLVDPRNLVWLNAAARGIQRSRFTTEQSREGTYGVVPAWWAAIDVGLSVRDRSGIGPAGGIEAASALRLREQRIDLACHRFDIGLHRNTVDRSDHFTFMPGVAPASGERMKISCPPGPAASTMPSDMPKRILRGARLATTTVRRPTSCAGS